MSTEVTEAAPKAKMPSKQTLREIFGIFSFVRPYRWKLIWGLVLLSISSLVFLVFLKLPGLMIDAAQGNVKYGLSLKMIGVLLVAVLLVQGLISYWRVMIFAQISERGIADVRRAVYEKLITLPVPFFEQSRVGELVSRISADTEKLYSAFSITLAEFVRQLVLLFAAVIMLAFTSVKLVLVMLFTFPVIVVVAMFFGKYIRKLSKTRQELLGESNTILSETLTAIQAVKSFSNEPFEALRYGTVNEKVVGHSMKYAQARALFAVFIIVLLFGALFYVIYEGAVMVATGAISVGDLVSFVGYTATIGASIAGLGSFYTELLGAVGATERVREILDSTSEVDLSHRGKENAIRLGGKVSFKDVRFSYPTRQDIPVLKGIDLDILPGQRIALVGTSGAGKSTIMQLLLQFYTDYQGQITVDDKDISTYKLSEFRHNFALVPQEVLLFGGTIKENILYGRPEATDAEVEQAARQANAFDFIQSFPEGFETLVGERGIKLSGGQRQRVAIARAILRDPAILLLDEATSSLDAESEKSVQEALNLLMEGRTSIIIAHRLSTIREVDRIYVLDAGRIVEQGTHDELTAIPDGLYSNLARLQFAETAQ
jgi:ATP-binding cassette, subfamily B, bacterial